MKKSDTEQEQPGLEENKVPDSQSKRELDRELQELAEGTPGRDILRRTTARATRAQSEEKEEADTES